MTKTPKRPAAGLPDKDTLIAFLREAGEAEKADIARAFGLKGIERRQLREMLKTLEAEGALGKRGRKGFSEAGALPPVGVVDVVDRDADGELYVERVKGGDDAPRALLLPDREGKTPAPGLGDRLLVKFARGAEGWEARLVKRLDAGTNRVLGVIRKSARETRVEPVDKRSKDVLLIPNAVAGDLRDGDLVLASIEKGDHRYGPKRGKILESIGREDDPRAASIIAIHAHGLPTGFSELVEREAEDQALPTLKGREDLREVPFITIDPADARDHDDAVYAERDTDPKNPGGWIVWVAIADVAAYVRPNSALDREARDKGNSTYFPDRVEPMLPEVLSNGLCSLKQGENRACMAVRMIFDKDGKKTGHKFMRGLMRSQAKLSYEQAQSAIDGQQDDTTGPIMDAILYPLWNAYSTMLKGRERRSPLAIESAERRIIMAPDGGIAAIEPRKSLEAHRLIEEMMIQANVCAAETLEKTRTPLIYRVHEAPSQEKIFNLADFLHTIAKPWNKGEAPTTKRFNKLLDEMRDTPHAEVVNEVVLRTQMQAVYSPDNVGHFGLHLDRYAHFTSPIRRYSDLIVHRGLIRGLNLGSDGLTDREIAELAAIAEQVTSTERRSMAAERDAMDRYIAAFLEDHVGATFSGRITGVTRFGLFVRLDETGADGLVPVSTLGSEYFTHDDRAHALVGERTGKRFTLGRRVEVKLMEATPVTGGLVLEMISEPDPRDPNAPAPRYGIRGRNDRGGGDGPPKRGKGRPGGPKPRNGAKPSGGLKGVRKGKRR
ncbi:MULTISPECIES: ribonuclease R [unclassified Brevundimonas]|uniref:ribonuclease R n=1 Tax=unclassified Brevundimonas TaxID=2622653 RepID=UPI000CFCC995|nr:MULTISPECIES: ribonuclease R [unclassified Brevundimonas]PRA24932.1 ribonuclease R [Brevundimonas sp. MYb27]PQZ75074.1 ribonuclease R [Brevundimonas sp. MYb31]PRB17552.1 ribonuclease R [Brevundimonas sp. MYb52]PRB37924.1 ribonuclease R [Brevundimonas sp. MYb46]PRB42892.1 ribonuclease R [Brevundimonas sp. MYb33]